MRNSMLISACRGRMLSRMGRDDTTLSEFGAAVAKTRNALGWSQKTLAEKLSERGLQVDATAVSRIESGGRSLRLTDALTIANALDVQLDDLVVRARSPLDQWFALQRGTDRAIAVLEDPLESLARHLVSMIDFAATHPDLPGLSGYRKPGDLEETLVFDVTSSVRGFALPRAIDSEELELVANVISAYVVARLEVSNEQFTQAPEAPAEVNVVYASEGLAPDFFADPA